MLELNRKSITVLSGVFQSILRDIGTRSPECGGVLGANRNGVIAAWYFDATGNSRPDSYSPDVTTINRVLQHEWMPEGVVMAGIVHSHAAGRKAPSCGDIHYGIRILKALDTVDAFYLPILEIRDTGAVFYSYIIHEETDGQYRCCRIDYQVSEG